MMLTISIDPGTNATGVCVWKDREPISLVTLRPPIGLTYGEKFIWLKAKLEAYLLNVMASGRIEHAAIEEWENFYGARPNMKAMMKCAEIRGLIAAVVHSCTGKVPERVSKKKISKIETGLLAKAKGLNGSKDALDAFQIGICAGFDRK